MIAKIPLMLSLIEADKLTGISFFITNNIYIVNRI
jgi:hypothetical protein